MSTAADLPMPKILVVEDDAEIRDIIKTWLTAEQHAVDVLEDGADILDRLRNFQYDIAVLDWDLPVKSGVDACKEYRRSGGKLPIIMLTGKSDIDSKTQGLDAGADDYLTKPFHPKELSARIRALLRRPPELKQSSLELGNLSLDPATKTLTCSGKSVDLLPKEFAILEFLFRHPDEHFSSEAIVARVWSSESESSPDTVRVHITKIRGKLREIGAPDRLVTQAGYGYKMTAK